MGKESDLIELIVDSERHYNKDLNYGEGSIITFLNPVSYLEARRKIGLFSEFDGIFADGSILVAAIRLLYGEKIKRRSFDMTSLAPELFEYAEKNAKSIYIVASHQDELEKAIGIFKSKYPRLEFAGYRNGYFDSDADRHAEIARIIDNCPDFLIVGMGILSQEKFLLEAKNAGFNGTGFTCGGFIHQTARNEIDYYPRWVDKYNLRFLYRMHKEKHTRKRYLQAAFIFPIVFFKDWIFSR